MHINKHHHPSRRSVLRVMVFVFCLYGMGPLVAQQDLQIQRSLLEHRLKIAPELAVVSESFRFQKPVSAPLTLSENGIWLPDFARENPAGHAPLCRMEVLLENQMTVPVWIRAGEFDALPQFGSGNLYVRMKLLRF